MNGHALHYRALGGGGVIKAEAEVMGVGGGGGGEGEGKSSGPGRGGALHFQTKGWLSVRTSQKGVIGWEAKFPGSKL